jgi:hypothetical protein
MMLATWERPEWLDQWELRMLGEENGSTPRHVIGRWKRERLMMWKAENT